MSAQSLVERPVALHRLQSLSVSSFWLVTASFYLSFVRAGYDPRLGILACTAAGIAFVLLRVEQGLNDRKTGREGILPPKAGEHSSAAGRMLIFLDGLLLDARGRQRQVGLMLIRVHQSETDENSLAAGRVLAMVREEVLRNPELRMFELQDMTVAVAERGRQAGSHLEKISFEIRSEFRARSRVSVDLQSVQLKIGGAIRDKRSGSATELYANAWAAMDLAEMQGRETLFRHM